MKCKTPDCETTMSEGAPDYCPKCQAGKCEACKGSGSLWHGDPPATFEAECHFCGGSGKKTDSDYRTVAKERDESEARERDLYSLKELVETERDRYREALEEIVEARRFIRDSDGAATARDMSDIAADALAGRAAGAGVGSDATPAEKETNGALKGQRKEAQT